MKKVLLALLLALTGHALAVATDTPTLTLTPTPTFTLTPTKTNTPVSGYVAGNNRIIVQAPLFLQTDGVTVPATTPVAGSASIWVAQTQSMTAAVFSTNTASARFQVIVPVDYQREASLWLYAVNSTLTNTVTVQGDMARLRIGALTSTAQIYSGPATNVQTQFIGSLRGAMASRVWIPLSGTVGTQGTLKPGDILNFNIIRTGTSGNLNVFAAEFAYKINYPLP